MIGLIEYGLGIMETPKRLLEIWKMIFNCHQAPSPPVGQLLLFLWNIPSIRQMPEDSKIGAVKSLWAEIKAWNDASYQEGQSQSLQLEW